MYEELVKALRETDFGDTCVLCEHEDMCKGNDCIIIQAADAIEELSHDYEKLAEDFNGAVELLHKRNCWIPVTERLPKEGEFVLVYVDLYPNKHDGGVIAVSKRMDWNYWQGFGREIDITHWMPLPSTEGLNET